LEKPAELLEKPPLCRYEIEKALVDGSLAVADVPKVWNEKMQEYLGASPESDAQGSLQDMVPHPPTFRFCGASEAPQPEMG
jgi:hypothetical protein